MPLGQAYGLDGLLRKRTRTTIPGWCYALLRFQVGIVYTYAGVAKLTEDWLYYAQPLDIWLAILLGHFTRCTLSILRFRQGKWRAIHVDIEPASAR